MNDRLSVDELVTSWVRSMRARNLAPKAIRSYVGAAEQLAADAAEHDLDPLSRQATQGY